MRLATCALTLPPAHADGEGRQVLIAAGLWALGTLAIFVLSQGTLPFHLKLFATRSTSFSGPIIATEGSLFVALGLIALTYLVTIRRVAPDLAARAPAVPVARAETLGMLGYAVVAQIIGAFLGHMVSDYAISLHMPGTLYGLSGPYTPRAALVWASYNFIVYAVLPFAYFRWRGYTLEQLNLRSNNLRADLVLIVIILVVESAVELLSVSSAIFSLSSRQLLLGAALTFVLNLFGTVLPIMIFIYCILLPRYLKLTQPLLHRNQHAGEHRRQTARSLGMAVQVHGGREVLGGNAVLTADRIQVVMLRAHPQSLVLTAAYTARPTGLQHRRAHCILLYSPSLYPAPPPNARRSSAQP